jgi:rhamnulokinase
MFVNYFTGLWIIQQCRQKWMADAGADISWDEIVRRSESAGPARAYINVDDPRFALPNSDMPGAVVTYCEKTGRRLEPWSAVSILTALSISA